MAETDKTQEQLTTEIQEEVVPETAPQPAPPAMPPRIKEPDRIPSPVKGKRSKGVSRGYGTLVVIIVVACIAGVLFAAVYHKLPGYMYSAESSASGIYNEFMQEAGFEEKKDMTFSVHFIDVGQGDCTLIKCEGVTVLIDAGESGNEESVIEYIKSLEIEKLDYVIATHPHSDHIGALDNVISAFEVSNIIMPRLSKSMTPSTSCYTNLITAVKESGAETIAAEPGETYSIGSAVLTILGPVENDDDLNNMSVVCRLDYGDVSFLFEGDSSKEEDKSIMESGADIDCDILKVGHHGSKTSTSYEFLKAVTPEAAVISVGEGNDYGHPSPDTVERLSDFTNNIYRTDLCSTIVITSDGEEYSVSYGDAA